MQNHAIYHINCDFIDMSLSHMLQCSPNTSKIWYITLHLSTHTTKKATRYVNNTYSLCYFVTIDHVVRRHVLYKFQCNFPCLSPHGVMSHVCLLICTKHDIHTSIHEHRGVESGPFGSGKLNFKTRQWPHAKTFSFTVKLVSHSQGTTSFMLSRGTLLMDWKA